MAGAGIGYVRVPSIGPRTADQVKTQIADVTKIRSDEGDYGRSPHVDRHVRSGHRAGASLRGQGHAGDARIERARRTRDDRAEHGRRHHHRPVVLLVDTGTSGAAELFASALAGNQRADLIGEHTIGRAGIQKAGQAPRRQRPVADDGPLPHAVRALPCTRKVSTPTVGVEIPEVEFGQPAPAA